MRIHVPRMALAAEDDVRRMKSLHPLEINRPKRLHENLDTEHHSPQGGVELAGAGSLPINRVVDEVDQLSDKLQFVDP